MAGTHSSGEPVVGVLGGMGPEATLAFYARLVRNTPATRDQDHLRVIIDSNPKIPDRTTALLGRGPSPVPMMAASIAALERAGAAFVVIPCVSAHAFLDELRSRVRLPIVSAFDAIAVALGALTPAVASAGLLATDGTVQARHLERHLAAAGFDVVVPADDDQAIVQGAIYEVKSGPSLARRAELAAALRGVAQRMVARGAGAIVLGCTEVPLVFDVATSPAPVVDVLAALATATVARVTRDAVGDRQAEPPSTDGEHA